MNFEEYFDTKNIKGAKQQAVAGYIAKALQVFCSQNAEFKQSVEQSSDSFQQCLDSIVKGVGNSISDLDLCNLAAEFYFETAEVHFNMSISLPGDAETASRPSMIISLDELLDF